MNYETKFQYYISYEPNFKTQAQAKYASRSAGTLCKNVQDKYQKRVSDQSFALKSHFHKACQIFAAKRQKNSKKNFEDLV